MKIQFKYQQFQADAAKAVCDVFAGQPYLESSYLMDSGTTKLFGGSVPAQDSVTYDVVDSYERLLDLVK